MRLSSTWIPTLAFALACGGGSANIRIGTMPDGGTYNGVWQSPQYGNMHMCQAGAQIVGDFEKDERRGRIQGTIQGDVLRFQWEERRELVGGVPQVTRGRGYFRLEIGQDGDQYFRGEWGIDDAETGGGPWNGAKLRRRRPTRCSDSGTTNNGGGDNYDDGGDYDDGDYDEGGDYDDGGGDTYDDGGGNDELQGLDEY